jgi:hypothetical protein
MNATILAHTDTRVDEAAFFSHNWSENESNGLPELPRLVQLGFDGFCLAASAVGDNVTLEVIELDLFAVTVVILVLGNSAVLKLALVTGDNIVIVDMTDCVALFGTPNGEIVTVPPIFELTLSEMVFAVSVVFVTTATLHNAWMPSPRRNRPTIDCDDTDTPAHADVIWPFVMTRPDIQDCEQTKGVSKSLTVQPGIVA